MLGRQAGGRAVVDTERVSRACELLRSSSAFHRQGEWREAATIARAASELIARWTETVDGRLREIMAAIRRDTNLS